MIAGRIRDLLPAWRATRWEVRQAVAWMELPRRQARPLAGVSAWNPGARPSSLAANRSRDLALRRWLRTLGVPHRRCRGWLAGWTEEGWLIPDDPGLIARILVRFGQLAGVGWDGRGTHLLWRWGGRRAL